MPSLRSSPRRIADVWTGTHCGMQETTWRRDDDRRNHSARMKATRVRQTERIIRDLGDSVTTNSSSSSGSGQHKRVRFSDQDLEPKPDKEAPVTRKRSTETDAGWRRKLQKLQRPMLTNVTL